MSTARENRKRRLSRRRGKVAREGVVEKTVERKVGGEVVEDTTDTEALPVYEDLGENPATVGVKLGVTKNMGDFNSVRVDLFTNYPCPPDKMDETKDALMKKTKGWLKDAVADATGAAREA